ncbi:syntaxin-132-like isoform X4 [Cucumis melo]|uniref:Syntaxin-132-like isoform X4 n=1 Tax=Cucumis melo TaxID=3656 RepID=A0ABM3KCP8_CUCME|nr:syntaxin-132-like isoform X4 [Cucumis melo]
MILSNSITEPFIVRDAEGQASEETDLEKGTQVLQSNSDFGMDVFNKQIQEAEIQVDKLSRLLIDLKQTLLKDANEESKSATNTSEIKAFKNRIEKYIDDVGKNACEVRGKLQVIAIDNVFHRQMPGCEKGTACDRERMNVTNVLTKKLKELLTEFEALHRTIQNEYCEVVERQVNTVTGTRPDEMIIDHLLETGSSKQIFPMTLEQTEGGKEKRSIRPTFSAEHIYGGTLLAMCSNDFICFYDWVECRLIRRIDVNVKDVLNFCWNVASA